jgi:hypothetical protein
MVAAGEIIAGRASVQISAPLGQLQGDLGQAESLVRKFTAQADQYRTKALQAFQAGNNAQGRMYATMAQQATAQRSQALQQVGQLGAGGYFKGGGGGFGNQFFEGGKRSPFGHSLREGLRGAGAAGAGGEVGYALMMAAEMGATGGAIALGVMAIAAAYKESQEEAEALRKTNAEYLKDVREAARWVKSLYQSPTTSTGQKIRARKDELEKANEDINEENRKSHQYGFWDNASALFLHLGDNTKTTEGIEAAGRNKRRDRNNKELWKHDSELYIEQQRLTVEQQIEATRTGIDKELTLHEYRAANIIADAKAAGQKTVDLEKAFAAERVAIIARANREIKDKSDAISESREMKRADWYAVKNKETLDQAEIDLLKDQLRTKYSPNRETVKDEVTGEEKSILGKYRRGLGESIEDYKKRLFEDADKNTDKSARKAARDKAKESIKFEQGLEDYGKREQSFRISDFARAIRDAVKTPAEHKAEWEAKLKLAKDELTPEQMALARQMEDAKFSRTEGTFSKQGLWGFGGTNEAVEQLKKIEQNTRRNSVTGAPGVAADVVNAGNPVTEGITMA